MGKLVYGVEDMPLDEAFKFADTVSAKDMNILLIKPKSSLPMTKYPPVSLATLAPTLKGNVRIVDEQIENIPNSKNYDLIGITIMTSQIPSALKIIKKVKDENKNSKIVVGGVHPTLFPEQFKTLVDYIVIGEGEYFTNHLDKQVIKMPLKDLDFLPVPDWSKVNLRKYKRDLPYESSRGCPYRCRFCVNSILPKPYRAKSVKKVLGEITILKKNYQIDHVHFVDDNFFVDVKRAEKIAIGMKSMRLKWFGECRADYIAGWDLKTLEYFDKCGCDSLTIGIESGSQRLLDLMDKRLKTSESLECSRKLGKTNIVPSFSFIIGLPTETNDERKATLKLARYVKHLCPQSIIGMNVFRHYPKLSISKVKYPKNIKDWDEKVIHKFTVSSDKRLSTIAFYYTMGFGMNQQDIMKSLKNPKKILLVLFTILARLRISMSFFGLGFEHIFYNFLKGKMI
jgi:radical SAM superfamily enzyme YgiQ (UPF0313 family)